MDPSSASSSETVTLTDHRDHTVCGICNVSFYVFRKWRKYGKAHNTNPGGKYLGRAYDAVNISQDEINKNNRVQVLVRKHTRDVQPMVGGYDLLESRYQDEEHFLTYSFAIGSPGRGRGTSCLTDLEYGQRFFKTEIKMCSHEDGDCVGSFHPHLNRAAVGVPFHLTCLKIFQQVSLHKYGKIVWAGLYELGMEKNHAGFKNIERDPASEMNHQYNEARRENIWLHTPGTEWIVANPFVTPYSIQSSYYPSPLAGPDPRQNVFSGDYRRAVGSIGAGALRYWGPRVATWRNALDFQPRRPGSTRTKKEAGLVVKKPRLLPPSAPASSSSSSSSLVTTTTTTPAAAGPQPITASFPNPTSTTTAPPSITPPVRPNPSIPSTTTTTTTTTPGHRDIFSTIPPETLVIILWYLSPLEIAALRLVSRKFAEIPMSHFRARLPVDMPWAFEIYDPNIAIGAAAGARALLPPPAGMSIDYKEMYRLLGRTVRTGVGAVNGMRNRKRVWEACETILEEIERRKEG